MTLWMPKMRCGKNNIDGAHEYLCTRSSPYGALLTFNTRAECRQWIRINYAYLKTRQDLQQAPHHWLMPVPVRVEIKEIKRDNDKPKVRPLQKGRRS